MNIKVNNDKTNNDSVKEESLNSKIDKEFVKSLYDEYYAERKKKSIFKKQKSKKGK